MTASDPAAELGEWCRALQSTQSPASRLAILERVGSFAKRSLTKKDAWVRSQKEVLDLLSSWFACLRVARRSDEKARRKAAASDCRSAKLLADTLLQAIPWVLPRVEENDLALIFSIAAGLCALELVPWQQCWYMLIDLLLSEACAGDAAKWHVVLILGCASAFLDLRLQTLAAIPMVFGRLRELPGSDAPFQKTPLPGRAHIAWHFVLKPIGRILAQNSNQHQGALLHQTMLGSEAEELSGMKRQRFAKAIRRAFTKALFTVLDVSGPKTCLPKSPILDIVGELADTLLPGCCIAEPIRLADVLLDMFQESLSSDDACGLVALEPLLYLMQHEGLEYEHIYDHLYAKLEVRTFLKLSASDPSIKGRFLRSVTRLLGSSHVPLALLGAYAKRLIRLAVDSLDPTVTLWSLRMALELVCRHVDARQLQADSGHDESLGHSNSVGEVGADTLSHQMNRPDLVSEATQNGARARQKRVAYGFVFWEQPSPHLRAMTSETTGTKVFLDPFLPMESDPRQAKASTRHLWEIEVLSRHYLPSIRHLASLFHNIPEASNRAGPMDAWCDMTLQDLIDLELRRAKRLAIEKPHVFVPAATSTLEKKAEDSGLL